MAENEIEVAGELGLPFTAKFSVRYRRKWAARTNKFVDDVVIESGLAVDELEARMTYDERLEDVLLEGVAKAGRVTDPDYREALARVVAAAFEDDAKVDEIEQLAAQLMTLDAFALRVLREAYWRPFGAQDVLPGRKLRPHDLRDRVGAEDLALVRAALARLAGLGLVNGSLTLDDVGRSLVGDLGTASSVDTFTTTMWGVRATELCARQLRRDGLQE